LFTNLYTGLILETRNRTNEEYMAQWNRQMAELSSGARPLSSLIAVPKTYQNYLDLGRFRNALVLDEAKAHPTEGLANFIATYRLQAYRPPAVPLSKLGQFSSTADEPR